MRLRPGPVVWALAVAQVALLWGTVYLPGLGVPVWHHAASLGLTLVVFGLLRRAFSSSRRFLALGVLGTSLLAAASGFWLLYWKEGIRVAGYQDWGVFWHVLWSWFAAVFFIMHTWINRGAYVFFFRASMARLIPGTVHIGAYLAVVVALVVTWSAIGRDWFSSTNYIQLGLYAWLAFTVPAYVVWWIARRDVHPALRHWPIRRGIDMALVPVSVLVVLSGVVLTFFDPWTDAAGVKYASKYWHVWPSVAFTVLAFAHGAQTWATVGAHWRSYRRSADAASGAGSAAPRPSDG